MANALATGAPSELVGKYIMTPSQDPEELCGWPAKVISTAKTIVRAKPLGQGVWRGAAMTWVPASSESKFIDSYQLGNIPFVCDSAEEAKRVYLLSRVTKTLLEVQRAKLKAEFGRVALSDTTDITVHLSLLASLLDEKKSLRTAKK